MTLFRHKYRVESARLQGYDYGTPGAYYVTIVTKYRIRWLGEVVDGRMELSSIGEIVRDEWLKTPTIRANVSLDEWVIMPNHLHGIVVINENVTETHGRASVSDENQFHFNKFGPQRMNLASIVRGFKSAVTTRTRSAGHRDFAWQSLYYDHIVRDENDLNRIRDYIISNPLMWYYTKTDPNNIKIKYE